MPVKVLAAVRCSNKADQTYKNAYIAQLQVQLALCSTGSTFEKRLNRRCQKSSLVTCPGMPLPAAGELPHDHGARRAHLQNHVCSLLLDTVPCPAPKKFWFHVYQVRKAWILSSSPHSFLIELAPFLHVVSPVFLLKMS